MQTHFPNSQHALLDPLSTTTAATTSSSYSEKAWHILSLLLSLGHPTSLPQLAARCTLFQATPDLIQFLAFIPSSPITLSSCNGYVTISPLGLSALKRFVSNSNLIDAFTTRIGYALCGPGLSLEDLIRKYFRKRKRIGVDTTYEDEKDPEVLKLSKRIRNASARLHIREDSRRRTPIQLNSIILTPDLFFKTVSGKLSSELMFSGSRRNERNWNWILQEEECKRMACEFDKACDVPNKTLDFQATCQEDKAVEIDLKSGRDFDGALCMGEVQLESLLAIESASGNDKDKTECNVEAVGAEHIEVELPVGRDEVKTVQPSNNGVLDIPPGNDCERLKELQVLDEKLATRDVKNETAVSSAMVSVGQTQRQLSKPSVKKKITYGDAMSPRQQAPFQLSDQRKVVTSPKEKEQHKRSHMKIGMVQKLKQKHNYMHTKDGRKDTVSTFTKDQAEAKDLPSFDSYIVEEEEGSGGYGIVYKARRKDNGTTVAIKCPHENAHRHHVSNELRMLERFGGKNFVIKFDGHFKHGSSECFVLEHVEHDRPEMLKKEIDVFQLRWYGYCLFRALASLHKQGIVHRDVKPGNFLFSRKANKGYLIDFNLAMDLLQKYGATSKLKAGNVVSNNNIAPSGIKYAPPPKSRRFPTAKSLDTVNREDAKGIRSVLEQKNVKRRPIDRIRAHNDLGSRSIMISQGGDGSGITSVKDATSTRTPSAERLREPLPCQGRKELISLLQEALHSPNDEASSVPAAMRKRVAAPHGRVDGRHMYLTPMPLHSPSIPVASTGLFKNKEGKQKKEGPCVGTKGFRAPEVLFRSPHQGPKVDVWSAGVTLLYLIIGRTPFYGEPEQNVKDIAKLRGSEDLWEVSKLHDRESSFPMELYDIQCLPSVTLLEWCRVNTKRQDFLNLIPSSLIDLVDKCLTVNPRLRISAEEALRHEFFAPCHEVLRKQRLLRQGVSLDPGATDPLHGHSIASSVKISSTTLI